MEKENNNFILEKPGREHLNKVMKIHINSNIMWVSGTLDIERVNS